MLDFFGKVAGVTFINWYQAHLKTTVTNVIRKEVKNKQEKIK